MSALLSQAPQLAVRSERASARLEEIARRQLQLETRVGAAKRFLEHAGTVQGVLEETQRRVNQGVVGGLSDMLTYLVQSVMGDPDRGIACETEVDGRGLSQVRFTMKRSGGETEDILEGNGGSIANIVCTGLRLIAVKRAQRMRKLLILDEPDCWLSPDRVVPFVSLLQETVSRMPDGFQVLLITHHDLKDLGLPVNTVDVVRQNGAIKASSSVVQAPQSGQIESLELRDWRSHERTVLHLGSGLTVLRGSNNIGKSAIVESLRCLVYGGARADVVRHGQAEACVGVKLVGGERVEMIRKRRGSPAVIYRWIAADGTPKREDAAGKGAAAVAPWMQEALQIWEVDDQQIHVADQKKPIFMLDQPATKQTAILSVGQEAQSIVGMLERFKDAKREAQQTIREGEAELERHRRLRLRLEGGGDWQSGAAMIAQQAQALVAQQRMEGEVFALLAPLRRLDGLAQMSCPAAAALPAHQDTTALTRLVQTAKRIAPVQGVVPPRVVPAPTLLDSMGAALALRGIRKLARCQRLETPALPVLEDSLDATDLHRTVVSIKRLREIQRSQLPGAPELASPKEASVALSMCRTMSGVMEEGAQARQENNKAKTQHATQVEILRDLEEHLGSCPLCGSTFAARQNSGAECVA